MILNDHPMTPQKKKWTEEDDNMLMERFQSCTADELAKMLGCCKNTVKKHAGLLGLRKQFKHNRNDDARAFIRMEYVNLSNSELAKRAGVSLSTVGNILKEYGLKRTPEQIKAHESKARYDLYKKERARVVFGLEQETYLRIAFANSERRNVRSELSRAGYVVIRYSKVIYYSESLIRKPRLEDRAMALGMVFKPLPAVSCAEETGELPASPAVLRQGNGIVNYQSLS